jgi:hypothetical protein
MPKLRMQEINHVILVCPAGLLQQNVITPSSSAFLQQLKARAGFRDNHIALLVTANKKQGSEPSKNQ